MIDPPANAIRAEGLTRHYTTPSGPLAVLEQIDLTLGAGRSVAIMGPSGVGKSTLLQILGTLDRPTGGRLEILGEDPFTLSERALSDLRARALGFVFQDHCLLPHLTALENTLLPTLARRGGGGRQPQERAQALLERVGLGDRMTHWPAELSGGERQRVAIARAMVNGPRILLCDEPTGNLDEAAGTMIGEIFHRLQADEGVAIVLVTHNARLAERFDGVARLSGGRLESQS